MPTESSLIRDFWRGVACVTAALLLFCVGTGAVFAQAAADEAYKTGMTYYDTKNYSSAISTWESLLTTYPDYQEKEKVWYVIASAGLAMKSAAGNEKAVVYLDKIVNQTNAQGQPVRGAYYQESLYMVGLVLFNQAEQYRVSGDVTNAKTYAQAAKERFDSMLAESPDSANVPQALYYLTQISVKYLQSAEETKKYTDLALAKIPATVSSTDSLWAIRSDCKFYNAWALGQLGQEEQARRIFGEFISAKDPKRGPISLYELAYTYYRAGNYNQALNELQNFTYYFPNDTTTVLNVHRLQAMCYFHMENYAQAETLMTQIIQSQSSTSGTGQLLSTASVEDYVYLILCYMKTQKFDKAREFIESLESQYGYSNFADGIKILRAGYYAEMLQYQSAVDLINSVLGMSQFGNTITFAKRPYTAETSDANKCGLNEEHFLQAASLLAVCYAKGGQRDFAWQIYNAMQQVSNEMYGRYSSIREKTQSQLNQIAQSQPAGTATQPSTGTGGTVNPIPPLGGGTASNPIAGSGTGTTTWGTSPTSTVQPGGSNSLANRPLTPAEQEEEIRKCRSRADSDDAEIDGAIADLELLLNNRYMSDFNNAQAAALRGLLLYKKGDKQGALYMFILAYEQVPGDKRDTETFALAAYGLGRNEEVNGNYTKAVQYYGESYATTTGQGKEFRPRLLYRTGTSLLKLSGKQSEALGCFNDIYEKEKTSEYWSHAALQLAVDDYKIGEYARCEEVVDELIAKKPDKAILDRVLYLKGELALRNKQWDIAAEAFDAICVFAPSDSKFVGPAEEKLILANSHVAQSTVR